eukprot:167833_1
MNNKDKKLNYSVISSLYTILARVLATLCLNEWRCSQCDYMNRICKINDKYLKPSDSMMLYCLVCGLDKIKSISNTLKKKTVQDNLYYDTSIDKIDNEVMECTDINNTEECKPSKHLLHFIQIYSQSNDNEMNYVSILRQLTDEE